MAFFWLFFGRSDKKRLQNRRLSIKLSTRRVCSLRPAFKQEYKIMANPQNNRGPRPQQRNNNGTRPGNNSNARGGARPSAAPVKQKKVVVEEDSEKEIEMEGVVSAVLAGTMFRVKVPSGHEFLAHISGKMRKRFIRLVVGDRVKIEVSPYDMTKARITFRLN